MADGNMDLSGAMEMLQQMLSGEEGGGQQLQNIVEMLSGGGEEKEEPKEDTGGMDMESMEMMMKLGQAMSLMNRQKDDDHTRLLLALRPFLKPERQEKVDHAMKFLKLGGVIQIMREVQGE